ncbi:MAG: glycosyltransferase family 4 protein [Nocardioides sp.]
MSRVLIANWRDPWHPEGGGSELYAEEVATRLVERGHDVTVFTAAYEGAASRERRDGITFHRRGGHLTIYPWFALKLLARRFGRIDAILETQNGMPFLATLFTRAPVVVLVHHVHREQWPVVGPVLARIGWFMESRAAVRLNRGNRYVAVSDVTRRELISLGVRAGDITTAYNGLPAVPETVRSRPPKAVEPRLVVLSRLVPHKQIQHAIELMPRVLAEFPDATLHVMGSGWWHDELVAMRESLGLGESVRFLGHVTEEQKYAELAAAWVHLLPSLKEGWGLSIVEAASMGTPSIAYRDAGGVQESIEDGRTGLLAEDRQQFVEQTLHVLRDAEERERLGANAESRATQFSWETTTDRIEETLGVDARRSGATHSSA